MAINTREEHLASWELQPGEGVSGDWDTDQLADLDPDGDDQRVAQPSQVRERRQRLRVVLPNERVRDEPGRVQEHVLFGRKRGDQHPVEREGEQERPTHHERVDRNPAQDPHPTVMSVQDHVGARRGDRKGARFADDNSGCHGQSPAAFTYGGTALTCSRSCRTPIAGRRGR